MPVCSLFSMLNLFCLTALLISSSGIPSHSENSPIPSPPQGPAQSSSRISLSRLPHPIHTDTLPLPGTLTASVLKTCQACFCPRVFARAVSSAGTLFPILSRWLSPLSPSGCCFQAFSDHPIEILGLPDTPKALPLLRYFHCAHLLLCCSYYFSYSFVYCLSSLTRMSVGQSFLFSITAVSPAPGRVPGK